MASSLSRITFTRGNRSITVDAPSERRWVAAVTGDVGDAVIRLPRSSLAASSLYVARGSTVRIHSEGNCGEWFGIIVDTDESDMNELILNAFQPGKLLGGRYVDRNEYIVNASAGLAASVLLREALTGVRGLTMGESSYEGGVMDGAFRLRGDAWGGLSTLMDNSDGEVHITSGGEMSWCGSLASARRYDTLLIAGGNLQDVSYQTSIQNQASEVFSGDGADTFVARSGDVARVGWPAQVTIEGNAQAAQRELEARSLPALVIEGGVTSDHWSIRERWFVQVLIPHAEFGGRLHRCRVLARSLSDSDHLMRLELHVIQPTVAVSISGAGSRQRPPQRPSSDSAGLSGTGSFIQVYGLLKRLVIETTYKAQFEAKYGMNYDQYARIWKRRGTWPSNIPRFEE
jgi:hypothetical protein